MPRGKGDGGRRQPSQSRSRLLVDCIRQAASEILEQEGPEALTTNNIARRAGVSIGSLYQYFSNKEEILALVYQSRASSDDEHEDAQSMAERVQDLSLRDLIHQIVARNVRRHRKYIRIHPTFYRQHHDELRVGTRPEDYADEGGDNSAVEWVQEVFAERVDQLRVGSPRLAALALAHGLTGTLHGIVEHDPELLFDDALIENLTQMMCAFLLTDVTSGASDEQRSSQPGAGQSPAEPTRTRDAEAPAQHFEESPVHRNGPH